MNKDLYRAFWRLHFYAGLIVLPFMAWLALTGGMYLFKPELERLIYRDWIELGRPVHPQPLSNLIVAVERQTGAKVTQVERPGAPDESWRVLVKSGEGGRTTFVNPATGFVLGSTSEGGVMETVRKLHSLAITGTFGNALIEIAAGWAIILVVTGFVLWWPLNGAPAIAVRGPARSRRLWRDVHASTGAIAGVIILFLAVNGMPWSVFWGAQLHGLVAANGVGRPKAPGPQPWEHEHNNAAAGQEMALPWTMQNAAKPLGSGHGDIGPDRIVATARAAGLEPPYTIVLPLEPLQPYSVSRTAVRAGDARVLYVDAATGGILQDARYEDFGTGAKVIEWGIATHQGQEYGPVNRWLMLSGCLSIILLVGTAPVLWWKRRVRGSLKLPPSPTNPGRGKMATAVALVFAAIYPLTGLTVLIVLLVDRTVRRPLSARH